MENLSLKRNSCGQGDLEYSFFVDGLEESAVAVTLSIPERCLSKEEAEAVLPQMVESVQKQVLGNNVSLLEIDQDLNLIRSLPEYGFRIAWESENSDLISQTGVVNLEALTAPSETVYLKARFINAVCEFTVDIPMVVVRKKDADKEKFITVLEEAAAAAPDQEQVYLPESYEGQVLTYRIPQTGGGEIFLVLGAVAAVCIYLKERQNKEEARKRRERGLMLDYSELVSGFLILTGAGYSPKQAWKRLLTNFKKREKQGYHPVYEEMQIALNQMETGFSEGKAYSDFGRRCGLHCYIKFAALLENSLYTGGKNLRRLLKEEVDEAFLQRKDLARRQGEEASTKLLIPMFLMLGVVMAMVVAPAFLSLGQSV